MIKNLLARLLANLKPGNLGLRPHTLSANFAPDSLIAHRNQHNLLERSILHLAPGEAAYLIINGQYTPVYEAGDYPLDPDNIPQTETADILYLNTAATARRPWQSAYQPSQRRLDQPLAGQYTLSIHDPETVCRTIIENQTLELDDDYLDQIISYTIDQSLIHEQVSADDIDYQTEALQNFLKAWLRPQLKPLGLTLHDLRIARRANPPRPRLRPRKRRPYRRQNRRTAPQNRGAAPAARPGQNLLPRPARPTNRPAERQRHPETRGRRPNTRQRPALAKRHDRLAARRRLQPLQLGLNHKETPCPDATKHPNIHTH